MGTEPHTRPGIREQRAQRADGGEPLDSERMSVNWSGNSLVIPLGSYAVKTHDLTSDDRCAVEVYPDGIWIDTGGSDE
jgi:hypothetical protein